MNTSDVTGSFYNSEFSIMLFDKNAARKLFETESVSFVWSDHLLMFRTDGICFRGFVPKRYEFSLNERGCERFFSLNEEDYSKIVARKIPKERVEVEIYDSTGCGAYITEFEWNVLFRYVSCINEELKKLKKNEERVFWLNIEENVRVIAKKCSKERVEVEMHGHNGDCAYLNESEWSFLCKLGPYVDSALKKVSIDFE
jgi:hypothetical protein